MDNAAQQQEIKQKTTSVKATETVKRVRGMVKAMYQDAAEAKDKGLLTAYCMVGSQYDEIIRAMDIVPVWTENYAGLCAAKRCADRFMLKAESEGYPKEVCSYVRTGIGFDAIRREIGDIPDDAPDGGMVKPDMLLGSSYGCDPRYKWYQALGRYMNLPTHSIDVVAPPVRANLSTVADYYVRYQYEQLRGLVNFLEHYTKKKLDTDRLWELIKLCDESWEMWYKLDQLRRAIPCPMPSEDHYNAMVPASYYAGTEEALAFYRDLYEEVQSRVKNKISVVPEEKYRLLMGGGLPPWHTMWIFNYFERSGAVFVIENAYRPWDPVQVPTSVKDPIEHIAWRSFLRMTQRFDQAKNRSGDPTVERLLDLIQDFTIDGVIFHASLSCRASTIGQLHWKNLLRQYVDIPAMQLVSDIVDLSSFSEAQWKSDIESFIEAVDLHKSRGNG
ncbi:2-hydroxyacyl-CoA dehydratase subunit D [Chloroflexota bacterium]